MDGIKHVGLYIGLDDSYSRGIARGVIRYAKNCGNWKLSGYGWMFSDVADLGHTEDSAPDGIIARVESTAEALSLKRPGVPVVDVAGAYIKSGFREVNNDDFRTGHRGGEYLRRLGHRHFAYAGVEGVEWSKRRMAGFAEAAGVKRERIRTFEKSLGWWERPGFQTGPLSSWLEELPKPVALFACNDTAGLKVTAVCKSAGIPVPHDIAVIGVDNEDILCELADPSLSSIKVDCETIGMQASELLDRAMSGGGAPLPRRILVPPGEIAERESTRIVVTEDRFVSLALSYIRTNARCGIRVCDILSAVPASRRNLEQRFKAITGKTLHEAIVEEKLNCSKRMLRETDLSLDIIAGQSGFTSLQQFHRIFRETEHTSPGRWRTAGSNTALRDTYGQRFTGAVPVRTENGD